MKTAMQELRDDLVETLKTGKDLYYTKRNTWMSPEFINKVEKI